MERQDVIHEAIKNFVQEYYGEDEEDACYNLALLASKVEDALKREENKPLPGKRIRCISMNDGILTGYSVVPYKIPSGECGTIDFIDDAGQIHVCWDNGSFLAIIPGVDEYEVI